MAKAKVKKEGLEFVPRRIDEVASEVREGWVRIEGVDKEVPLSSYLKRKEEEANDEIDASRYGLELKVLVREYLRTCGSQDSFQTGCRKLSYALAPVILLKGAPFASARSYVDEFHQTHFARACLAMMSKAQPLESGPAPKRLCIVAQSDEELKRERARLYRTLYEMLPKDERGRKADTKEIPLSYPGSIQYLEKKLRDEMNAMKEEIIAMIKGMKRG